MKTRKSNVEEKATQSAGCCTATNEPKKEENPCCEQPSDDASCCDKTESKEVNSEKTG